MDLVVAGHLMKLTQTEGFIYFQEESACSVNWMLNIVEFNQGVSQVVFNPQDSSEIYGVAQGLEIYTTFFRINDVDSTSPSMDVQELY